jgi:hypothetical protein
VLVGIRTEILTGKKLRQEYAKIILKLAMELWVAQKPTRRIGEAGF